MLTIKAPITLKCTGEMVPSYESFCERIQGNYSLLQVQVTGEELLHVVTRPPEVYLMEGGGDIISQTTVNSKKENNLEVLNQFLNRITVENNMPFTYQDKVYITSVLHKLGIFDVQNFMTQVSQLKEEALNTEQLVSLYWQHMEELREMVRQYRQENETEQTEINAHAETNSLYLHEEIMNRLQTGLIYQIMQNFSTWQGGRISEFTNYQLRMSDHYRVTKNILLNKLENTVRNESVPLSFYHENYYEELPFSQEITQKSVVSNVTAAALLQMIDNIFEQKIAKSLYGANVWMHLQDAFYQTAENVLTRLTNEERNYFGPHVRAGDQVANLNREYRQEIQLLHSLIQESAVYEGGWNEFVQTRDIQGAITQYLTNEERNYFGQNVQAGDQIANLSREYRQEMQSLHNLIQESATYQEERNEFVQTRDILEATDRYHTNEGETVVREYPDAEESDAGSVTMNFRQEGDTDEYYSEEDIELISQRLQEINKRNLENRNTYEKFMQNLQLQKDKRSKSADNAERMRQESLEALQNPQELLHRYQEEAEAEAEKAAEGVTRAMEMLPQDTRRIYRVLDQYLNNRGVREPGEAPVRNDIGLLMQDAEFIKHSGERARQETAYLEPEEAKAEAADAAARTIREQFHTESQRMVVQQTAKAVSDRLSLVHKVEAESQIDETILEELLQRGRTEKKVTEVSENSVQSSQRNIQNVQTQMNTRTVTDTEDIAEMIQRGVRRQMGEISEQVYSRIEKKLQNERKRRGI